MSAVLDTHAALWYLLDSTKLPNKVFALVDGAASRGSPVYVSAVTLVEVAYLVERRRIPADSFDMLLAELQRDNPAFVAVPSHTSSVSSSEADTARRPPAVTATPETRSKWPERVGSSRPSSRSHTLSVSSAEADIARRPSLLTATPLTIPEWPVRVCNSGPGIIL